VASRRARVQDFYFNRARPARVTTLADLLNQGSSLLTGGLGETRAAASADRFNYRGPAIKGSVVVRTDLNGYSTWARERSIADRVALLDDFFTQVMLELERCGGVYFRDEGDCIVSLFSDYFTTSGDFASVRSFCLMTTARRYGTPKLTAKTSVASGQLAFFQKGHEQGSEDWSAEGEPFVKAARLEQAVDSKQRVYWYAEEYDALFAESASTASSGGKAYWREERESIQVPGLQLSGGWSEVVYWEYLPGGVDQP
jgi:class 3 adenylate cyclase